MPASHLTPTRCKVEELLTAVFNTRIHDAHLSHLDGRKIGSGTKLFDSANAWQVFSAFVLCEYANLAYLRVLQPDPQLWKPILADIAETLPKCLTSGSRQELPSICHDSIVGVAAAVGDSQP